MPNEEDIQPNPAFLRTQSIGIVAVRPIVGIKGAASGTVPLTTGVSGESDGTLRVAMITLHSSSVGKVFGTSTPNGGTNTLLYTVPTGFTAEVTALIVCNRGTEIAKVRVGIDVGGNGSISPANAEWIYYDLSVDPNSTVLLDAAQGLFLGALDDITVYTDRSTVSFMASGKVHGT